MTLPHINNYCRHVKHIEELDNVMTRSNMVYNPKADDSDKDIYNMCFDHENCDSNTREQEFFANIKEGLRLTVQES